MKVLRSRVKLLFFLHGIALLLCIIGLWFHPLTTLSAFNAYWLLPIVAVIIVITPLGNRRLQTTPNEPPRHAPLPWMLLIVTVELSLLAIYFGIGTLSGTLLPILTHPHPHLSANTLHYLLLRLGLFPWVGFALLGAGMGYCSYRRDEDAYFSATLRPLTQSSPTQILGIIANTTARLATACALTSTIALISLLISATFLPNTLLHHFSGFNPITMITLMILLIVVFGKKFNPTLRLFTIEKKIAPIVLLCLSTLLFAVIVITLALFFGDTAFPAVKTPHILTALLHNGWGLSWKIFTVFWWLSWTPLIGTFIAKTSRGYSVRALILATLALPAFIGVFMLITAHHPLHYHTGYFTPLFTTVLPLIGFVLLLCAVAQKKDFTSLMQAYQPKRDRVKYRTYHGFTTKLLKNTTLILCLCVTSGILVLSALFFVLTVGFSLLMLVLPVALIPLLWRSPSGRVD